MTILAAILIVMLATPAGAVDVTPRIVGGGPIQKTQFPELAALLFKVQGFSVKDRFTCSATVIDATHVLTAAHCAQQILSVDGSFITGLEVQVGSRDLGDPKATTVDVASATVNKSWWEGNISRDVGILTLASPVAVPGARLAGKGDSRLTKGGSNVTIAGWGTTEHLGALEFPQTNVPTRAHVASVPVVDDGTCKKFYDDNIAKGFFVPPTDICAGNARADACFGDSGGPMYATESSGQPIEVGVTSRGFGCATIVPGIWTDVAALRGWIDQNTSRPCTKPAIPDFPEAGLFSC